MNDVESFEGASQSIFRNRKSVGLGVTALIVAGTPAVTVVVGSEFLRDVTTGEFNNDSIRRPADGA